MSCFKLLKGFIDEITKKMRQFWWGRYEDQRKVHWVHWQVLRLPKYVGGMGFKELKVFNLSLIGKQAWPLLQRRNDLWSRVLKGFYFPNSDFLSATRGGNASWAWVSLLDGRDVLMRGLRWKVGHRDQVRIWVDAWVPSLPHFRV